MLTGYPPFQSKTQEEIYKKVRNLSYVWPKDSDHNNHIPEEAKSLVSACLNLVDEERPDPDDIVEHPFFNMYDGCIPRQLEPSCRTNKPLWLKEQAPRGDCMISGYGLDSDDKLRAYVYQVDDPSQRYHSCKAAFYSLCGVGRKPDGSARKSVGRNCSKSAYAECETEDSRGLRPVIPLPMDFVYRWPHDMEGDWCLMETSRKTIRTEDSAFDSSTLSRHSASIRTNPIATSRTNAALVAAQQRRMEGQSHAASLRQQARAPPTSARTAPGVPEAGESSRPYRDPKESESASSSSGSDVPSGGLAERPIRTRRMVSASQAPTARELEREAAPQIPKSTSVPSGLGKTRSQSRRLEASGQPSSRSVAANEAKGTARLDERRMAGRQPSLRSVSRPDLKIGAERSERRRDSPSEELSAPSKSTSAGVGVSRSNSKSTSAGGKSRSSLGISPLFHMDDVCELIPGTSLTETNTDLRLMLTNLVNHNPNRRRSGTKRSPHAYVIKWVDYTNRYGIGYVLDDGSVGCVFKGDNGQPATSVVVRDGERHIRRKARSVDDGDKKGIPYSEAEQLISRTGDPVEFYENCDDQLLGCRGIRRAFISPSLFDHKTSRVMKLRINQGSEDDKSDAEKVKRVKLVDQFGKYMIGSLGRLGDEGVIDDNVPSKPSGQFIKFYQRLGNVGIWGFGDGAFQVRLIPVSNNYHGTRSVLTLLQFNFPDHTKLVIAPGRTRSSSPWIDFYHLSPSAARYFAAKGKMHPSGFDTRAVASDEAATFLSIIGGSSINTVEDRIREILDANSFLEKVNFITDVLKAWIKYGRLGGRPVSNHPPSESESVPPEMFWQGTQVRSQPGSSGLKYVWVTVGAPDGDGVYRSMMLKDHEAEKLEKRANMDHEKDMDLLRERMQGLGRG